MKKIYLALGITFGLFASGCATIISGSKQTVNFTSTPHSATVYIDEVKVGETPYIAKLKTKREYAVKIELEGYLPYETKLTKAFNGWYLGNLLIGGVIGFIIDPITGAMFKLEPKMISAEMQNKVALVNNKDGLYVAVSLDIDENWVKVGQLAKIQ